MRNIFVKHWKYILILIIGLFIGLMINYPNANHESTTIYIPVHDTIIVDSIRIKEKTRTIYKDKIDTFYLLETDTVYLRDLPIEYKNYKDVIKTDSSSTEININYHGFSAGIDNIYLKHSYYHNKEIIPELKKRASPFIYIELGPKFYPSFKSINGATIGIGAGLFIKDKWGIGTSYNFNTDLDHLIKFQLYRKW